MKKTTARSVPNSERVGKRTLRLAQETVRRLSSDELAQAAGGCVTPSWTTEQTDGASALGC
jgi:hypothetical protein